MRRWLFVDGPNIAVPFYEAQRDDEGNPPSIPAIAKQVVRSILKKGRQFHTAGVALEGQRRCYRYDIYKDYKNRQSDPRPPIARRLQPHLGLMLKRAQRSKSEYRKLLKVRTTLHHEADDVLGAMLKKTQEQYPADEYPDERFLLWTTDHDSWQLVDDRTRVYYRRYGNEYYVGPDDVRERYGVPPSALPDLKALMGDSSDGIPGIDGVGEKTAARALQSADFDLEKVLAAPDQHGIGNKNFDPDDIRVWRQLVTIQQDAPLLKTRLQMFLSEIEQQARQGKITGSEIGLEDYEELSGSS